MSEALGIRQLDPYLLDTALPLSASFYPFGFPVHIVTNSTDVLEALAECWSNYRAEFDVEPIRLRVVVLPEGDRGEPPVHRGQGNLHAVIGDQHNFATLDRAALTGMIFVSEKTAADHVWLRWFYIESLTYLLLAQRYLVPIHAGCLERNGTGVVVNGPSGAGKSTLAFACARAGWTYLSDDCTWLLPDSDERIALGRPWQVRFRVDAPALFPELEGRISRERPNGKVSIEVPMSAFPEIRTAARAPIGRLVFVERRPVREPRLVRIGGEEAIGRIMRDLPSYGPAVDAMHERTVRKLAEVPSYVMRYERLDDAISLLAELVA